jgi:sulfite exporter TauE/SafE
MFKTLSITGICGFGHVLSSVALGFIGIALGVSISEIEGIETARGDWAAIAFVVFGALYMLWGIFRAYRNKPHKHLHFHSDGVVHEHTHEHAQDHDHMHKGEKVTNLTPWILFIIFLFGPCEPLVFYIIYPAVNERGSISQAVIVSIVFSVVTILTMMAVVYLLKKGLQFKKMMKYERYMHAIAGAMILISGIAIMLGL